MMKRFCLKFIQKALLLTAVSLLPQAMWAQGEGGDLMPPSPYCNIGEVESTLLLGFEYSNDNGEELHYSIDYADETLEDVTDAIFSTDTLIVASPFTVTAYVKLGDDVSEITTGKYFGFAQKEMTLTYNGQQSTQNLPEIVPATEGLTVSYSAYSLGDYSPVSINETTGAITVESVGTAEIMFDISSESTDIIVLNVGDGVDNRCSVTVNPAPPTFSLPGGIYSEAQELTISSGIDGAEIWYYYGDDPETGPILYEGPIDIEGSVAVNAWVTVDAYSSDTVTANYIVPMISVYCNAGEDDPSIKYVGFEFSCENGEQVFYSIDYVDESLEDVTDVLYNDGDDGYGNDFQISGPCTITANLKIDGDVVKTLTAKYFDFAQKQLTVTYDGQPVTMDIPAITPETDGLTVSYEVYFNNKINPDALNDTNDGITVSELGNYRIVCNLSSPNEEPGFAILNEWLSDWGGEPTTAIRVLPAPPTFSLEEGIYDEPQKVELTSGIDGAEIRFSFGAEPNANPLLYRDSISIETSTVLNAWVVANRMSSDTVTVNYTIREDPPLMFYDPDVQTQMASMSEAQAKVGVGFVSATPALHNPAELSVSYSSSDETVATIDEDGVVTIVGAGETTITATSEATDIYKAGSASYTLTVTPGVATLSGEDQTVTYNGQPQAYTGGSATAGSVVVTYYISDRERDAGNNGSTEAPTNARTYYVRLTQGDSNYTSDPVNATFIIQQAPITTVKLIESTLTYSGEEQTVYVDSVKAGDLVLTSDDYTVEGNTATNVGTYTVTVTANWQSNFTGSATAEYSIINRTISTEDVTFAEGQTFATYYNTTESLELPEGLAAYIVTEVSGSNVLTLAISYIPQGVPVLLEKITDPDAAPVETIDEVGNNQNLLHGTDSQLSVNEVEGGKVYVLYNNDFVKALSGTIPANRAYLLLSADQTAGSRLHIVVGDDETNGIDTISTTAATSDTWYDMNGRKLNGKPTRRGLYLQRSASGRLQGKNGKISVVK